MKLEVGMYVRTKEGHIDKIIKIDNKALNGRTIQVEKGELDYCMGYEDFTDLFNPSHYEKASFNIIDLIEVGDYANGVEVIAIDDEWLTMSDTQVPILKSIAIGMIKTIVTKEQFENMEYKIGEYKQMLFKY